MTKNKGFLGNKFRILLKDLLFSFLINILFILASIISGAQVHIYKESGFLYLFVAFVSIFQFLLCFIILTLYSFLSKRPNKKLKLKIYALTNSIIILITTVGTIKDGFEGGSNSILLYSGIIYILFIWFYNRIHNDSNEDNDKLEQERITINDKIRNILPNSNI
jgi:amino acid transporter